MENILRKKTFAWTLVKCYNLTEKLQKIFFTIMEINILQNKTFAWTLAK